MYASFIGVIVGIVVMIYGARDDTKAPVEKPVVAEVNQGDMT